MILWGVSMMRNEEDIVEAFVRHNLAILDGLLVVDHNSTDATSAILASLCAERLPLVVMRNDSPGYLQAEVTTTAARQVFARTPADFVFPLDADEFLKAPSRGALEAFLASLPPGTHALLDWPTYAPPFDHLHNDTRRRVARLLRAARRIVNAPVSHGQGGGRTVSPVRGHPGRLHPAGATTKCSSAGIRAPRPDCVPWSAAATTRSACRARSRARGEVLRIRRSSRVRRAQVDLKTGSPQGATTCREASFHRAYGRLRAGDRLTPDDMLARVPTPTATSSTWPQRRPPTAPSSARCATAATHATSTLTRRPDPFIADIAMRHPPAVDAPVLPLVVSAVERRTRSLVATRAQRVPGS
ncbi:MAG: glycosyltransferase family 2 protein [Burkholderiales bacterium]